MDKSFDVPDPTDWLDTPLSGFGRLESSLHCQICKDFFNTPMITSCSHTFCSLCIRRCLTEDGTCPSCRASDQQVRLRPNYAVQEILDSFLAARDAALRLGKEAKDQGPSTKPPRKKRRVDDSASEYEDLVEEARQTRSSRRQSQHTNARQAKEDKRDEEESGEDGLAACPICEIRMKEALVWTHMDVHNEQGPPRSHGLPLSDGGPAPAGAPKSLDRLPQVNYSLLKENALRKKLSELGIPNNGPKGLLILRHKEWVNLVNANCDSKTPRSKRDLLRDLDTWDRTQGRPLSNGPSANMISNKDFDGQAWASSHGKDFDKLIADARRNAKVVKPNKTDDEPSKGENHAVQPEGGVNEATGPIEIVDD